MKMNFGSILTAALMSTVGKLIASLGVGVISFVGFDALQKQFVSMLVGSMGAVPIDALQIFYIGGGGVFLNWILGAMTFAMTLKSTKRFTAGIKGA